jgi:cyclopropane fatty-acyl-phospholipid synthase-like methyltransferase
MALREKRNIKSLLDALDLTSCQHLLDLGGGPGLFAIAFAEKYPDLRATVFDTPETEPIASDFFKKSAVSKKLKFMGGDFLKDDFGRNYDAVLLSSILHIYGPEENITLLRRVNNALKGPGKLIIRDFGLNKDKISPEIGVLFAVNMLINTDRGNSYSYDEMKSWLHETGFGRVHRKTLEGRMMLIEARKK